MAFPFIPGGLLLALAVLGGTMALFGLALKALDWTIDTARGSAVAGIVSGLRDRQMPGGSSQGMARPAAWAVPSGAVEETVRLVADLEHVAPDVTRGRGRP
jgi:hypothetical protein